MGNVKVVLGGRWTNRTTTAVERVGTSNKSEYTRESEMPGACLAFFYTAGGETDSTVRKCVPQTGAIAPAPTAMFRTAPGQRLNLPCATLVPFH